MEFIYVLIKYLKVTCCELLNQRRSFESYGKNKTYRVVQKKFMM